MNTIGYLEEMLKEVDRGITECHKYPNSTTKNLDLAYILLTLKNDLNHVVKELLKGNIK